MAVTCLGEVRCTQKFIIKSTALGFYIPDLLLDQSYQCGGGRVFEETLRQRDYQVRINKFSHI